MFCPEWRTWHPTVRGLVGNCGALPTSVLQGMYQAAVALRCTPRIKRTYRINSRLQSLLPQKRW
jgi:hypothetical protein